MGLFGTGTNVIPIPKFIYAVRMWEQNKHIDFQEYADGPEITAEINEGYYLPDDFAVAVTSAFNFATSGASGASAEYDVSYSRTNDKFTISRTDPGASAGTGIDFETIDPCTALGDWYVPASADDSTEPTVGAQSSAVGGSAIYMGKDGTDLSYFFYTTNYDSFGASAGFFLDAYITDVNELLDGACLRIILSTGPGISNFFIKNIARSSLSNGKNELLGGASSTWAVGGGSPDWNDINHVETRWYAPAASSTIAHGNLQIDNLRVDSEYGFNILWNSGTNAASGAGTAMGYDVAADATGASTYESDNAIPNRIISSQPIRRPKPIFDGMNRSVVSESGIHTTRHVRTDIFFSFEMMYIPENEMKDEWALFMGIINEVSGPWNRKLDFEFYPKATATGDYIVFHPEEEKWDPVEMLSDGLVAEYRWTMRMREVKPKAGTLSLIEIYTRTPG
jgi:hypothetical protein